MQCLRIVQCFLIGTIVARKVALADIEALTFTKGLQTTGQRSLPVQQLSLVGGNVKGFEAQTITCKNLGGHGGDDLSWSCTAELPEEFQLGSTNVQCESWNSSDDHEFILDGSCGLEYTMYLTDKGEEIYGQEEVTTSTDSMTQKVFKALFFVLLGGIVFNFIRAWGQRDRETEQRAQRPPRGGGGGGGGHGGTGGDDSADSDYHDQNADDHSGQSGDGVQTPLALAGIAGVAGGAFWHRQRGASARNDPALMPSTSSSSSSSSVAHGGSFRSSTSFGSTSMR